MAGLSILCVDDDPDACASMSDILTDLGYVVSVAYDGHAALQLVQQRPYGLALLDYRHIRQLRPGVVAVFVTAFAGGSSLSKSTGCRA
jgi:DNA-binding response OmpR family regulator